MAALVERAQKEVQICDPQKPLTTGSHKRTSGSHLSFQMGPCQITRKRVHHHGRLKLQLQTSLQSHVGPTVCQAPAQQFMLALTFCLHQLAQARLLPTLRVHPLVLPLQSSRAKKFHLAVSI